MPQSRAGAYGYPGHFPVERRIAGEAENVARTVVVAPVHGNDGPWQRRSMATTVHGNDGTGEILGRGAAFAYEFEEVDKERFVKLYIAGLKQASGLSKAGLTVFEIVYLALRESPGKDTVNLSQDLSSLAPTTFRRGLRELLEKEFLFRSPYEGTFFVNIRFMFNGDRLAFVKGYKLRRSDPNQGALPLPVPGSGEVV